MNDMNRPDAQAHQHYADPDNRAPAGPARRRRAASLSNHLPVRFQSHVISDVKRYADKDGMTVSSWIRAVVEAELERRRPIDPQTGPLATADFTIDFEDSPVVTKVGAFSGR